MEGIEVLGLEDGPGGGAERGDGIGEPAPRDEEALVGVDVRAVGEAETLGPVLGDGVVHVLGVFQEGLRLGGVTSSGVLLGESLGHVDGAEGPLGGPDFVIGRGGAVLGEGVSVADTSDGAVDVVAGPELDVLPDLVGGAGTEVLVDAGLAHDGHAPGLAIDGETAEDVEIDGEVAGGVDVAALRDDLHAVGELTLGAHDGGRVEPLVEALAELGDRHKGPLELSGLGVLGVVGQDFEEGGDGGVAGEVVLVGDVLAFFRIGREDLGTPRAVEEGAGDVLEGEESGDDGDAELDGAGGLGVGAPVALLAGEDELGTADGGSHVVVVGEASGLKGTEHGAPDVLTGDGLPIVEVDDTVDVPLGGGVIIGPGVLPGGAVGTGHGVGHGVLGADHAVEEGAGAGVGGSGVGLAGLGVEVGGVGGVGDGLERAASNLLGAVQEAGLVGADVGDAAGVTLVDLTGTGGALVQDVLFVDVGDLVETPEGERDLPDGSIVQVEAEAGEGALLDTDHRVEGSVVAELVEGADGEVGLGRPVDLAIGEDVVVGARDTVSGLEDVEEPQDVVGVGLGAVGHVGVLGGSGGGAVAGNFTDIVAASTGAFEVGLGLSFMRVLEAFVFEVGEVTHVVGVGMVEDRVNVIRDVDSLLADSLGGNDERKKSSEHNC